MFASIMQITFPETDKVVYKSREKTLASMKSTLLQIKIPSFPSEIESSDLKQMSRGLSGEHQRWEVSKENQGRHLSQEKVESLLYWLRKQKPFLEMVSRRVQHCLQTHKLQKVRKGRHVDPRKQTQ